MNNRYMERYKAEVDFMEAYFGHLNDKGLLDYLKVANYYNCPASIKYHGAFAGGLFAHSRAVTQELVKLTDRLGLVWQRYESPYIVGMLHDLCKMDNYKYTVSDDGSIEIEWNDKARPGHGRKSAEMVERVLDITDEERACIIWHMGAFDDKENWQYYNEAIRTYPNVLYTHTADMIASQIRGI